MICYKRKDNNVTKLSSCQSKVKKTFFSFFFAIRWRFSGQNKRFCLNFAAKFRRGKR